MQKMKYYNLIMGFLTLFGMTKNANYLSFRRSAESFPSLLDIAD
jgi:hypothetical protein